MINKETDAGRPPETLSQNSHAVIFQRLLEDLEANISGFDRKAFYAESASRWENYVPHNGRVEKLVGRLPRTMDKVLDEWSDLVPENLRPKKNLTDLLGKQGELWEESERGLVTFKKNLLVAGTFGTGKSGLAIALEGANPLSCRCISERWEDNRGLQTFYRLLAAYSDPARRQDPGFGRVKEALSQVQGKVQGWFAADEFRQMLMTDLDEFSIIDDTPLGQDGVYFETQAELGYASGENIAKYRRDNDIRQLLLPPHLRIPTGLVFVWAPLEVVRKRIVETRGRDFEQQIPAGYIARLQKNLIGWMIRVSAAGVPVKLVNADRIDFRPGKKERLAVAQEIWKWAEGLKGRI